MVVRRILPWCSGHVAIRKILRGSGCMSPKGGYYGVASSSRHNIDVEVAVEVPRHVIALGIIPVIVGLAVELRVTNIDL